MITCLKELHHHTSLFVLCSQKYTVVQSICLTAPVLNDYAKEVKYFLCSNKTVEDAQGCVLCSFAVGLSV